MIAAVLSMVATTASAHDFEVNGIYYKYNNETAGTSVSVTYKGSTYDANNEYSGVVNIPTTVTYIGRTYSVTIISEEAFRGCSGLTSVTIPNSVTSIGNHAFRDCSGLTSVTIGNGVTSIGGWAFWGCSGLTSVTIPNSVTSMPNGAFSGCSGLTSIKVESGNTKYDSRNNCNAIIWREANVLIQGCKNTVIPNSVTSIGSSAFSDCSGLTSVTIPNSVTSIGDAAFYGCSGLTSVTIPNSVTSIGNSAFSGCSGLTSVTIGNSVTSIGYSAFSGCRGLTSATIPNSVTSIRYSAFSDCTGLTSVTIGNSVTSIERGAFDGTGWYNNQPDGVLYLDNWLIGYKGEEPEGKLVISEGTRGIADYAFDWSGLTSVTIPNSVTSIGAYAFCGCSGLTSVTIPNSVTSIEFRAFMNCSGLTSVTIGNSVTSIGEEAFCQCSGLTSVVSEIETPFTLGFCAFCTISSNCTLTVPAGTKDAYIAAYWTENIFKGGIIEMVSRSEQTLDYTLIPEMIEGDAAYSLPQQTAQGLALTWSVADATIASISGNQLTPLKAGTTTVTATQAGNDSYLPFTKDFTLTVYERMEQPAVEVTDISQLDNVIYIEPMEEMTGSETSISIKMKNTAAIRGFQFDLVLPEGVTPVVEDDVVLCDLNEDRAPQNSRGKFYHDINATEQSDGSYRVLCGSQQSKTFIGTDGEVAVLYVNIASDMSEGDYPVVLKNIKLTETDISLSYQTEEVVTKLTVFDYIPGDINGDRVVDVSDYIGVANHILGNTPSGFNSRAADVNADNAIDVSDYIGIANIILTGSIYGHSNGAARSMDKRIGLDPQ